VGKWIIILAEINRLVVFWFARTIQQLDSTELFYLVANAIAKYLIMHLLHMIILNADSTCTQ